MGKMGPFCRTSRTMLLRTALALSVLSLATLARADDPKEFAAAKYRLVGPFAGGRVSRACGVPGDPLTYYAATAAID